MDLETAKKLNEALLPLGYTVGKIGFELDQFAFAIKASRVSHEYDITNAIEGELNEIIHDGGKEVEMSTFRHYDILKRYGME